MREPCRPIEECRFRQAVPASERGIARCKLIAEISGIDDVEFSRVRHDACIACCSSFAPSIERLNPVVASLLYTASSRLAVQCGVTGRDVRKADALKKLALKSLSPGGGWRSDATSFASHRDEQRGLASRLIPAPQPRSGSRVRTWAVGVTTAPRAEPTLSRCLPTLIAAGWDRPRLFVDGCVELPAQFAHLARTYRDPVIGAWPSYYLALVELLMREPGADAYMLVQDDVQFCRDPELRAYLEAALWPPGGEGVVSIYCSRAYTHVQPGWYRFHRRLRWGALAFIFSRNAAQRFLADHGVVQHRRSRRRNGLADISWVIGRWALSSHVPLYYTTPSLVQHVGETSAVWPNARLAGNRRASWFADDDFKPL